MLMFFECFCEFGENFYLMLEQVEEIVVEEQRQIVFGVVVSDFDCDVFNVGGLVFVGFDES